MYQIAVLAALEDAVDGLNVNDFDLFLGASSGASVAAALAGGSDIRRMYRALLDPADDCFPLERKHILKMDVAEWGRAASTVVAALKKGMSSALSRAPAASPAALWEELDRLYDSLPAGFFSLERYERFFAERLARRGVPNAFAELRRPLRIIAHDLDLGHSLLFGDPEWEHVPVTRACTASMALPPFFSPVVVGDRYCMEPFPFSESIDVR
jgi:predicted acylesterase/phospholipase RssA